MKAYRKNGKLIIEFDEDGLCHGAEKCPCAFGAKVTDRERFLNHIAERVCEFSDFSCPEGESRLTQLLDALLVDAIESDAGVEIP